MATIRLSETEATRDFASLLARVRAGAEIVIESEARAVAILRPVVVQPGRLLSESIARAESRGSTVTLDGDFGRDLQDDMDSQG